MSEGIFNLNKRQGDEQPFFLLLQLEASDLMGDKSNPQ